MNWLFIVKMLIVLKWVYQFNKIPFKFPTGFGKKCPVDSKVYLKVQRIYKSQNNFEKEKKKVGAKGTYL